MPSQLIKLNDGTVIEVEAKPGQEQQIAASDARRIDERFADTVDRVKPLLVNAARPVLEAWRELSADMQVEQAEIELGLSFETEGNVFIARGTAGANMVVKLTLKPKA